MKITNSTPEDISLIFSLYDAGTLLQKKVAQKQWLGFEPSLIEKEINEKRLWKIVEADQLVCVFSIAFNDPAIWKEKDSDPAIYIHRIATHPDYHGNGYVKHIVAWCREYAIQHQKQFIRMDTGSGNDKLNNYYVSCGFNYLGVIATDDSPELPAHYKNGTSSLFEIQL
ncbi:GNAT family N-acetyltransferase [Chitinophaga polysaccharea]|uniref:GNAT family N-acetyltransferase n=1 Tax=Chitinophaga polysaccharea TaxID=1293035 RepID=UPI0014557D1C|nr:GNAT family N-acetyltransferase [Chitinophaga polysaccharea]NLR61784.1 GNAT family N-acetyltransferase [Chitinophaga polysaccharea]